MRKYKRDYTHNGLKKKKKTVKILIKYKYTYVHKYIIFNIAKMNEFKITSINSLKKKLINPVIIGVIIANPKPTLSPQTYADGTSIPHTQWSFTLRDSTNDTINVNVYGTDNIIFNNYYEKFDIGDVIQVINPRIVILDSTDKNNKYLPNVSSIFTLKIEQVKGKIKKLLNDENQHFIDIKYYKNLISIPMKNVDDNLKTLNDIQNIIKKIKTEEYIDILCVVTFIAEETNFTNRNNIKMSYREINIIDPSIKLPMQLKLWEKKTIKQSKNWLQYDTVLYINDALIKKNYLNQWVIEVVKKTIITENPTIPETSTIRTTVNENRHGNNYKPTNPHAKQLVETIDNIKKITDINIQLESDENDNITSNFTTIIYAKIDEIKMDNPIITKCSICQMKILPPNAVCTKNNCRNKNASILHSICVKIDLTDETGYLLNCHLTGDAAEKAFKCSVQEFQSKTNKERNDLILKMVGELCDIKLHVRGKTDKYKFYYYNILSLDIINDNIGNFNFDDDDNGSSNENDKDLQHIEKKQKVT